ncbi:unnamed protein product [Rotaria sp. Silwood2]|nr:unnamed protein product [Rotaria sp. Silwood2]CAF2480515.1 unnamed protein product [Rotaria sp. Silwood2]CAF2713916.1 unnamed protein product [Rotaria sp. Silwood2]CAF3908871.1 unnamed protein product [Rotaria sp. Silwood2]CAF4089583.1 unnamed protein product [Rotaria sp. Silwood2]
MPKSSSSHHYSTDKSSPLYLRPRKLFFDDDITDNDIHIRNSKSSNHIITTALARLTTRTPPSSHHTVVIRTTVQQTPLSANRKLQLIDVNVCQQENHLSIKRLKRQTINNCSPLFNKSTPVPIRRECNVNPFMTLNSTDESKPQKRKRSSLKQILFDEENLEENYRRKKVSLKQCNVHRFNEEFHTQSLLGSGEFGNVYLCVNRLDGCAYAIKKSKRPIAGSSFEMLAWKEVCAQAVLKHPNILQYYSAWAEDDHMYIQSEFCNGGNLAERIRDNHHRHCYMDEKVLRKILLHIANGLAFIHSKNLVHLDIKPDNIFISINDELFEEKNIIYKIGDLGHVTDIYDPLVEEGDSRYLAREVLQQKYQCLPKADVFSLALTIFVAGTNSALPKNGDEWDRIRDGKLPQIKHCSDAFNDLLLTMIKSDVSERPSSSELAEHPIVSPVSERSKNQLFDELQEEQRKNSILAKKLLDYMFLANELERVCSQIRAVDMNKSNRESSPLQRSSSVSDFRLTSVS